LIGGTVNQYNFEAWGWSTYPAYQQLSPSIPNGTYEATIGALVPEYGLERNVPESPTGDVVRLGMTVTSGPEAGAVVYDWFYNDPRGWQRLKLLADAIGVTIPDGWDFIRMLRWLNGNTYNFTVSKYFTLRYEIVSRVQFDGWAPL
jgi:hypothetical protein